MGGESGDKGVGSAGVRPDPLMDEIIAQLFSPKDPANDELAPFQPKTTEQPGAEDKYKTSPLAKYMNGKKIPDGPFVGLWMDKVDGHGTNRVTSDEGMPRFTPDDVVAIGQAFYADLNDEFDSHKVFVIDGGHGIPMGGEAYIAVNTADKGVNELAITTLKDRCILTGEGATEKCEALKKTYLRADHTKTFWEEHGGTFWTFGPLIMGLGIAISMIAKHLGGRGGGGGNPTGGGGRGGEPKLVYDGHTDKWIPDPRAFFEAAAGTAVVAAMVMLAKKAGEEMAKMMPRLALEAGAGVFTESTAAFVATESASAATNATRRVVREAGEEVMERVERKVVQRVEREVAEKVAEKAVVKGTAKVVGKFAARWVPVLGEVLLAYDAVTAAGSWASDVFFPNPADFKETPQAVSQRHFENGWLEYKVEAHQANAQFYAEAVQAWKARGSKLFEEPRRPVGVAPLPGTSDYDRDVPYTEMWLEKAPFKMGDNCGLPRLRLVVKERTHYGKAFKSVDLARSRMGFPPMSLPPSKPLSPEEIRAVADWISTLSPSSEPKGAGLVARK